MKTEPGGCPAESAVLRMAELLTLKDVKRTGWLLRGVNGAESVADHSWGTALLCLLLAPPGIELSRALIMALVHDVAEVEVGDIPRRVDPAAHPVDSARKEQLERRAIARLSALQAEVGVAAPQLDHLRAGWAEYAEGASPEAQFVRDMNLLDMCLQALVYEREQRYDPQDSRNFPQFARLDEFFETSRGRFMTEIGRSYFTAVEAIYQGLRRT